jgi:hypothetical protein
MKAAAALVLMTIDWRPSCGARRLFGAVVAGLLLATTNSVMAAFFVAPDGSDVNPGTSNAPFATLGRARDAVRPLLPAMAGDITIHVAPGDYFVTNTIVFTELDSGQNGFSVLYQVDGVPGSARFIGGEMVSGWAPYSNGISVATVVGPVFHTLYENGHRARKARTPNLAYTNAFPMAQATYLRATGVNGSSTNLIYAAGDLNPTTWDLSGAQVMLWSGGNWAWFTDTVPIAGINPTNRLITLSQATRYPIYQSGVGSRYFVQGILALLDQPGEFHYDATNSRLYYYPVDGPAAAQEIIVPRVQRILSFQGANESNRVSHLKFVGLGLEATDFTAWFRHAWVNGGDSGENHLYPQYDRQMNMPQHRAGMVYCENTDSLVFDGCELRNAGYSAFYWFGCNHSNTIQRCWLSHCGHSGVYLEGRYPGEGDVLRQNHITDTLIQDVGELVGSASGVDLMNCSSNEVAYCDIYNSPRYAVVFDAYVSITNADKYSRGNWMHHLRIHDCDQDSGDTAPIYSWGSSTTTPYNQNTVEQTLIDDTWAHPSMTDVIPDGVFMDNETLGQVFRNMEVRNSQGTAFRLNGANFPVLTNVSWQSGFSTNLMDYASIGVQSDFPYPVTPSRVQGHAAGGISYLSWLPVANAAKYRVYVATNGAGPFALLGSIAAPGFVDLGGAAGVTRWYAVSSFTAMGDESSLSKIIGVTPASFPIAEDFESGLARWSVGKGTLHLSANQAHSPTHSFVTDQDMVVAYLDLGIPYQGAVQVWMYDPGTSPCQVMARADSSSWDSSAGWAGLGISSSVSAARYCYRIEGTTFASGVARTPGWHQLAWDYSTGTNVALSIDGVAIITTNNTSAFRTIAFGDWWGDGVIGNAFFDDVLISPVWNNDADHNGIDDTWEMLYFGHLLGVAGAAMDADGDGMSNYAEYLAGTDPTDPNSSLRILQVSNGLAANQMQLTFASVPCRAYDLQSAVSLAPPAWSNVQTNIVATDTQTTLTIPTDSHRGANFFRVRLRSNGL